MFQKQPDGEREAVSYFSKQIVLCDGLVEKLKQGQFRTETSRWQALEIDKKLFELTPYERSDAKCTRN